MVPSEDVERVINLPESITSLRQFTPPRCVRRFDIPVSNTLKSVTSTTEHKHVLIMEAMRNRFQYGMRLDIPVYRNLPLGVNI